MQEDNFSNKKNVLTYMEYVLLITFPQVVTVFSGPNSYDMKYVMHLQCINGRT